MLDGYITPQIFTAPFRKLPGFLLIGANGSGTTSFFRNLNRHPEIARPYRKELHFFWHRWNRLPLFRKWFYRQYFPLKSEKGITGEATPIYIFVPVVPKRVVSLLPDIGQLKIIALLRNPARRAYSHHQKHVRNAVPGVLPFAECVERELSLISEYPDYKQRFFEGFDKHRAAFRGRGSLYLARGMYADQLRFWFEHFPRENFLIINSNDYYADPIGTIERTATDFLGLSPWTLPRYHKSKNQGHNYPDGPLDEGLHRRLMAFYRPYNQDLYDLLGEDFGWEQDG
jgi:hypothetical protein